MNMIGYVENRCCLRQEGRAWRIAAFGQCVVLALSILLAAESFAGIDTTA